MYQVHTSHRFEKSLKKCIKRGLNINKFKEVLDILSATGSLPKKYNPHKLSGKYAGAWECHIEPDWLLVWEQNDTELILLLIDTGTHSDLF
jgi:mRNA interferase YafQ